MEQKGERRKKEEKRLWTAVFAVGFLIGLGGGFSVQAGEIDALHLINLLKQKG